MIYVIRTSKDVTYIIFEWRLLGLLKYLSVIIRKFVAKLPLNFSNLVPSEYLNLQIESVSYDLTRYISIRGVAVCICKDFTTIGRSSTIQTRNSGHLRLNE